VDNIPKGLNFSIPKGYVRISSSKIIFSNKTKVNFGIAKAVISSKSSTRKLRFKRLRFKAITLQKNANMRV